MLRSINVRGGIVARWLPCVLGCTDWEAAERAVKRQLGQLAFRVFMTGPERSWVSCGPFQACSLSEGMPDDGGRVEA